MNNIKNDSYYFLKALKEISIIEDYTKNINSYSEFISDGLLLDGVMFRLVQLIEHIKNISKEFKNAHSIFHGETSLASGTVSFMNMVKPIIQLSMI